jgi:hypothetical protein
LISICFGLRSDLERLSIILFKSNSAKKKAKVYYDKWRKEKYKNYEERMEIF